MENKIKRPEIKTIDYLYKSCTLIVAKQPSSYPEVTAQTRILDQQLVYKKNTVIADYSITTLLHYYRFTITEHITTSKGYIMSCTGMCIYLAITSNKYLRFDTGLSACSSIVMLNLQDTILECLNQGCTVCVNTGGTQQMRKRQAGSCATSWHRLGTCNRNSETSGGTTPKYE